MLLLTLGVTRIPKVRSSIHLSGRGLEDGFVNGPMSIFRQS